MSESRKMEGISALSAGFMQNYASTGDLSHSLKWILPKILTEINALEGAIFLAAPENQELECVVSYGPIDIVGVKVPAGDGLVGQVYTSRRGILVEDARNYSGHYRKIDDQTGLVSHSILTVPVVFSEECFGSLQAMNRVNEKGEICSFDKGHLKDFEQLGLILGVAIKNVRMTNDLIADALIKKDLKVAEQAQISLFSGLPQNAHVASAVMPARQLAGDFVDYRQDGEILTFCQGDVAGKGVPAAMTVARCIALFRFMLKMGSGIEAIANQLNQEMYEHFGSGSNDGFVTFLIGSFDIQSGVLHLINCGHGDMLMASHSGSQVIPSQYPPLGVLPSEDVLMRAVHLELQAGQKFFAYTDGLLEAFAGKEAQSPAELQSLFCRTASLGVAEAVSQVLEKLRHAGGRAEDDATLLVVGPA